jgi:hypothetical protein
MKEIFLYVGLVLLMIFLGLSVRACQARFIYNDMRCVFAECRIQIDPESPVAD